VAQDGKVTPVEVAELAAFLAEHPPFDALGPEALDAVARGARVERYDDGAVVLDAFRNPTVEVFVVLAGHVSLWTDADHVTAEADEVLAPGGVFGFSAMLTERSVGPRAVAKGPTVVARIPAPLAGPAFASRPGARFLAETMSTRPRLSGTPTYSIVDELIVSEPLVVEPTTPVRDVACRMTEENQPAAVVRIGAGRFGLVTDRVLRTHVLVPGRSTATPAQVIMDTTAPIAALGDSAAEALMLVLDRDAEFVLVADRAGELRGVVGPRDFAISPTTAGVSLHEQLRRAGAVDDLVVYSRRVPSMLDDMLSRGLASARVIAIYSAFLDTIIRRAIALVFERHEELSVDAFTWLSLGSNGRREAVLSSDVDSAVAFDDAVPASALGAYRAAFAEVYRVLTRAGLSADSHGATAQHEQFSRSNADWRAAAEQWLAKPAEHNGAMMTSLLVDGRPIHGDPGLPAVSRVFSDLREHPGTMRLLLRESLSRRAKQRTLWRIPGGRPDTFDVKTQALLPVVNLARWAALSVGSAVLPTTERLRAAAGSVMLPGDRTDTLIQAFEVLQRLRLRYQLRQYQAGERPSDVLALGHVSPIDRSVVTQAVREIAAAQRRMDNVSHYLETDEWVSPGPA
jgi:CBS domain-containing protein